MEASLGFEPRVVVTSRKYARAGRHLAKPPFLSGESLPCPVFALEPDIRLTTDDKSRKNLSQSSRKVPGSVQGKLYLNLVHMHVGLVTYALFFWY